MAWGKAETPNARITSEIYVIPQHGLLSGDGVNFAVFSAHAEMIELCLFTPDGRNEMARLPIIDVPEQTSTILLDI